MTRRLSVFCFRVANYCLYNALIIGASLSIAIGYAMCIFRLSQVLVQMASMTKWLCSGKFWQIAYELGSQVGREEGGVVGVGGRTCGAVVRGESLLGLEHG